MNYELAKELKEAGYPLETWSRLDCGEYEPVLCINGGEYRTPTLSELIEACGESFLLLRKQHNPDLPSERATWWKAESKAQEQSTEPYAGADEKQYISRKGSTPEEAVARLWLSLNK